MIRSSLRRLKQWAFPVPPLQYVSGWSLVPPGDITTLLPKEQVPTPETKGMEFEPFSAHLARPHHQLAPVRTVELSNIRYCPTNHCLLKDDGTVLLESTGPGARPVPLNQKALERPVLRLPGTAVPFHCFFQTYYHLLIDTLSRFDLLNFEHFRTYPSISLLCPGGLTPVENFLVRALLPDNVTICPIAPNALYAPDRMLLTSFITTRSSGYLRGPFATRLRSRVSQPFNAPRRLLLSRQDANTRRICNEDELYNRLRPFGFERCLPSTLSLPEQIAHFQAAEMVVAPHGAGLANLLFSDSTAVLELFGSQYVVPHYYLLSKSLGLPYSYLTGTQPHHDEDFTVDVEAVASWVDATLKSV